jgi:glycosyltransferase involved in cell wall biosynthesis
LEVRGSGMKIAILGTKGIPATWGGIERHVEELAMRFVRAGHEVTVYCRPYYTTTTDEFYEGIRLKKLPTIRRKNYDAITHTLLATLHLLREHYDMVHYHAIGPATLSIIPRVFGKKTVATVHGLDWQREKWGRRARTYLKFGEHAAVWFPHSTIAVSECRERPGFPAAVCHTLLWPRGRRLYSVRCEVGSRKGRSLSH